MKALSKFIVSGTSLWLLAGTAFGQTDSGQMPGRSTSSSGMEPAGSQSSGAMQQAGQGGRFFNAKDLIGKEAKNAQGERLGKIDDVAFNPQSGQTFAAIGVGSGRYALVPWQALTMTPTGTGGKEEITLNKSKNALESGPTVEKDQWQKLNESGFAQSIYNQYNMQAPTAVGGGGAGETGGSSSGAGAGGPTENQPSPRQP